MIITCILWEINPIMKGEKNEKGGNVKVGGEG